jgi:hypothetical protein
MRRFTVYSSGDDGPIVDLDQERRKRRRNRALSLSQLRAKPRPVPLIKGVVYSNMEHNLFGPQGTTKTFLVVDMVMSMAYSKRWMGLRTKFARTLVICGEGGGRLFADRIDAWLAHHGASPELAEEHIRVTEYPVAMLDDADVNELLHMIREQDDFDFIVIDTLSANFGGGDENTANDMSIFCSAMRRVRLATNAGVMVVHHTGHADKTRPQGSNIIRRDIDIELRVDRDTNDNMLFGLMGGGELKSRHGAGCGLIPYRLNGVKTGFDDDDGEPVESCVIVPTQDTPNFEHQKASNAGLGKNQNTVLSFLSDIATKTGQDLGDPEGVYITAADFKDNYMAAKLSKQAAYDVRQAFIKRDWIIESVGGFKWFPE